MIKHLLLFATLLLTQFTFSQTIPNLDLEQWDDFGSYMEPSGNWTTANKIVLLSALNPVTTSRTTDAHGGMYAAKIETDAIAIINTLITGTLALGEFDQGALPPNNLKQGIPYTGRPTNFKGWYKFTSVNGDSCSIYAWSYKYNSTTGDRDTVAFAGMIPTTTVGNYTQFDLPFTFFSQDTPDSLSIVVASSAEGEIFQGQVGNTVWVDDFEMTTATGLSQVLMPELKVTAYPNPTAGQLRFSWERSLLEADLEIYGLDGKLIASHSVNGEQAEINVAGMAPATYYYLLKENGSALASGQFIVQ